MKGLQIASRVVLGLIYIVFGGMGLAMALGYMTMPQPEMPPAATAFMEGMMGTGYFFEVLKGTEVLFGLLLLIGVMAPVALVVLAPVTLHIFLFHLFLTPTPTEMILPSAMLLAHILAMSGYWKVYKPLFKGKV